MGFYAFKCHDCGESYSKSGSMQNVPTMDECEKCQSSEIYRDYSSVQTRVFNPYVDAETTGVPVELTSFKERDALLKSAGLTMDRHDYVRKPRPKKVSERIDKRAIIEQVRAGKAVKREDMCQDKPDENMALLN